ncbi:MAG: DUF4330 family protein [Clostridia bacterium]|nr:DUF4330 family protein [Clostridia bacterium]
MIVGAAYHAARKKMQFENNGQRDTLPLRERMMQGVIKVLNIISDLNIGGAGKCVINFCKNFDRKEFEIVVVVPEGSQLVAELKKTKVKVIEVNGLKNKSLDVKSFFELLKVIRAEKPDIVHTHASSIARLAARFVKGTKIIYTRHSVFPVSEKIKDGVGRWAYKTSNEFLADRIIAVAEAAKENLTDGGIDENMIDVILNGVDKMEETSEKEKEKLKKQYGIEPDEKVVGILARLEKVKGHEYFIDSAKIILDAGVKAKFLILGTGAEEENLKAKVQEMNLQDKIIFTGFIKNVKDFVNIFDVQVNCSYGTEATSLALLEGMSIGVPAVVTNYGGNPGVIQEGENGFLVPIKEPEKTAEAVIKILNDAELNAKMKKRCIEIFNEKFTSEVYTKNIEEEYRKVEETKKKRRINLLDIVIILLVLVVGVFGIRYLRKSDVVAPDTVKVVYQIRTNEIEPVVYDRISEDTDIYDSVKNYYIGKIKVKELLPAEREVFNEETDEYVLDEVEGKINVLLTIEADGVVSGKDIVLGGGYDMKVGNAAYVKGKGYAAIGYVVAIERLGD